MLLSNILLGVALTGVTLAAQPNLAQDQICPQDGVVPAAMKPRIIRQDKFGYRFNIPDNYRAMGVRGNGILVFDPNSFTTAQCQIKNKVPTEYPKNIAIYTTTVNSKNRNLAEIIKQSDPTIEKLTNTKVANQTVISYISNSLGSEKKVSFFSPNRKYIITISAPYNFNEGRPTTIFNETVFNRILSSFSFTK
jgi:hypothetical protein